MQEHHNGVTTTEELETVVSDLGVLFREFRGDGFLVVGDENIYVVHDHEENDFAFTELASQHIQEMRAQPGYPSHRLERSADAEPANKEERNPCAEIKIWVANHTTQFYADAGSHKVSAALVNFKQKCDC